MRRSNPWSASTLAGAPVRSRAGETLGRIEDLVLDPSTGNLSFAVISFEGLPEMGGKLVAVPWSAISMAPGNDYVVLERDRRVLVQAPAFQRGEWPDMSDAAWRSRIHDYYGSTEPAVMPERTVVVHRDHPAPRREMSAGAAVLVVLLLVAALGFTYLVMTRGWDQTRQDVASSMQGVTYAMKETSSDAALTAKVKTALSLNKRVPAGDINVDSSNDVVTLRGDVHDEQTRTLAGTIAQDTPGVRAVQNHLYVVSSAVR